MCNMVLRRKKRRRGHLWRDATLGGIPRRYVVSIVVRLGVWSTEELHPLNRESSPCDCISPFCILLVRIFLWPLCLFTPVTASGIPVVRATVSRPSFSFASLRQVRSVFLSLPLRFPLSLIFPCLLGILFAIEGQCWCLGFSRGFCFRFGPVGVSVAPLLPLRVTDPPLG